MKYLLAQPAGPRFKWELDVLLTNLRALDPLTPVVLLFLREDSGVTDHFRGRYPFLEIYEFEDDRTMRNYLPTIRPYLIWRWLKDHPEAENGTYFQIDSDVVFRELPDFSLLPTNEKACWVSDCSSYLGWGYLTSRTNGRYIVERFSEILSLPVEKLRTIPGGGAQWLYPRPTAQLWWHIWQDSQLLWDFMDPLDSDVQKWTAEMWAQLYNLAKFGWEVKVSRELAFCKPTEPIDRYHETKILHNAGVTAELSGSLFYKGEYIYSSPFGKDLSYVTPEKASWHYARAIERAYNHNV